MLSVKLTKNYTGVSVCGDYNDLDLLYDSIVFFLRRDYNSLEEEEMSSHLFGFLYDVRHSYQSDREIVLTDNNLNEEVLSEFGIEEGLVTDNNLYFSCNYLLTDLILDSMLINYFINSSKRINRTYISYINYFYELVLNEVFKLVNEEAAFEIIDLKESNFITPMFFCKNWFESLNIEFIKLKKTERKKNIMNYIYKIYNCKNYPEYEELREKSEKVKYIYPSIKW